MAKPSRSRRSAIVLAAFVVATGVLVPTANAQQPSAPAILAVVGRQVAWLNLEAPRHRVLSKLAATSNALEVTAQADGSHVVAAVGAPFASGGPRGADLVSLDPTTGETTPLLAREDPKESLNSPAWWPDHTTLLYERQDLGGQPVGAPGQEVPRYPSRIERIAADGTDRSILLPDGRQPNPSPDGTRMVFARTTNQGASLLLWSQQDGSVQTIVPEGRFADVAYPQFSPDGSQIAFVAPQSGVNGHLSPFDMLLGVQLAFAHGIPWDPWLVSPDGSGLKRIAETGADEPSVAWSPDATQLFVYSGTGSFLIDVSSGTPTPLSFVQGYGPVAWVNN